MDYWELVDAHRESRADITIAAYPVDPTTATQMGIFRFERDGHITAFEEKPDAARLKAIGRSIPPGATFGAHSDERPFLASMGVYVFSRTVLLEMLERESGIDFGRELIPGALERFDVQPFLYRGYWVDVGTIESYYEANIQLGRADAPFTFWDARRPTYTRQRHLSASRFSECLVRDSIVSEGCVLDRCEVTESVVGIRSSIGAGSRIRRSVVIGSDFYEERTEAGVPALGIGRDVMLDRVVIDKNARIGHGVRLVNEAGIQHADAANYHIRSGIIVVPKGAVIPDGTVV
jgi:glucose-1-phosphate adenylyltransferase